MSVSSDHPPDRALPDLAFPPPLLADDLVHDAIPRESAVASDAEVIRLSLRDPERFAEIFHRHFTAIHRYAAARLGAGPADDVAADTFLAAFRLRERYDISRDDARGTDIVASPECGRFVPRRRRFPRLGG